MNRDAFFKGHGRLIEHLLRKVRKGLPALQAQISAQAFSEALYRSRCSISRGSIVNRDAFFKSHGRLIEHLLDRPE